MRYSKPLSALFSVAAALSGCAAFSTGGETPRNAAWLRDGGLTLSRPVPDTRSASLDSDPILGFMPSKHSQKAVVHKGHWLKIDRASKEIELMDGDTAVESVHGDGIQSLKPGKYSIVHKQEAPLWYAPNNYFESRLLSVPSESNSLRYRRGALGNAAIFLDENTPIHNGPIWRDEIGGVRVEDDQMARLFQLLDVGSVVEIR